MHITLSYEIGLWNFIYESWPKNCNERNGVNSITKFRYFQKSYFYIYQPLKFADVTLFSF